MLLPVHPQSRRLHGDEGCGEDEGEKDEHGEPHAENPAPISRAGLSASRGAQGDGADPRSRTPRILLTRQALYLMS